MSKDSESEDDDRMATVEFGVPRTQGENLWIEVRATFQGRVKVHMKWQATPQGWADIKDILPYVPEWVEVAKTESEIAFESNDLDGEIRKLLGEDQE